MSILLYSEVLNHIERRIANSEEEADKEEVRGARDRFMDSMQKAALSIMGGDNLLLSGLANEQRDAVKKFAHTVLVLSAGLDGKKPN
jgi:hypothetical protein